MPNRMTQEIDVTVKSWDGKLSRSGKVSVESWNKKERTIRAFKALGIGWALAFVSIFLPGAHFILVPGFLIGSPIFAYFVSKQKSVVLGGQSLCPNCGKNLEIVKGPDKWPLEDVCSQCHNHVWISKI